MSVTADIRVLEQAWDRQRHDIRKKALIRNICSRYGRSHPKQLPLLQQQLRSHRIYAEYLQILGNDPNWVEKSY